MRIHYILYAPTLIVEILRFLLISNTRFRLFLITIGRNTRIIPNKSSTQKIKTTRSTLKREAGCFTRVSMLGLHPIRLLGGVEAGVVEPAGGRVAFAQRDGGRLCLAYGHRVGTAGGERTALRRREKVRRRALDAHDLLPRVAVQLRHGF